MTGGSHEIIVSTASIVKMFCSPGLGRQPAAEEKKCDMPETSVDDSMLKQVSEKIHYWNADGASDCQLAGQLCVKAPQARPLSQQGREAFPEMKLVNWDAAHASRRLTSRPWAADRFVQGVVTLFVMSPSSIVRLVQNSQELRMMMKVNKDKLQTRVGQKVANFAFAPHRYDSTTRPIGRAVHNFTALLQTAVQIARLRTGTDAGNRANEFLEQISTEKVLQLAFVADAGAEAIVLTRLLDRERARGEDPSSRSLLGHCPQ
jgi:hypothetical protein